ncbi:hypothetical protein EVAR_99166_1 [Eumeta japonica]|uniref:Uncharacterized protein n=1 Tax=Eumeta variegata TaxID=151549 RepID=A0A4C1S9L9_EUMVA|nr:hypothetical protein EVAR_99166_1 [Eumeta japonica]
MMIISAEKSTFRRQKSTTHLWRVPLGPPPVALDFQVIEKESNHAINFKFSSALDSDLGPILDLDHPGLESRYCVRFAHDLDSAIGHDSGLDEAGANAT